MADGPSHYREAERLADRAAKDAGARLDKDGIANTLALAQVHATLALAAATAMGADSGEMPVEDIRAWVAACSLLKPSGVSQ